MHFVTNLLHLRDDLQWSASRVARVTGASTIEALRLGDDHAALKARSGRRAEWRGREPEARAPRGKKPATYRRGQNDVHLESGAEQNSAAIPPAAPSVDPQHPQLFLRAG